MTVGWRSPLGGPRYDGPGLGEPAREECRLEGRNREASTDRRQVMDVDVATECKHAAHHRLGRTAG
ncbi:hypothetical protein C491_20627 [Natronococcus amylolyticus DSM 10524]|uniref:Uncharacterized protein n=1 Tax=Natronococcus amylolyticus DSM 10524 TaxID=1227497 RepID=L9WWS4_9EURY|nr:hypothetical protein C491_20627 [Natronococcus amylolyticus DSM 10524]